MNRIFVFALLASLGALAFAAPTLPLDGDEALLAALSQTVAMQAANLPPAGDNVDPVTGDSGSVASSVVADVESGMASSRLVRYIKISNPAGRSDWMSISWVACFDRTGKNVCANKQASASTRYSNPWGNPSTPLSESENTGQGEGNAFITGNQDNSNWWKVDLGAPGFDIKEIKFRGRNDCAYVHNCPNQYAGLLITMEDKDGTTLAGSQNQFTTTSEKGTVTLKVPGSPMGYEGKHDEHLAPIVDLLESLKDKLRKAVTVSQNDVAEKKKKRDAIRSEADKADGQYETASKDEETLKSKSDKEIEMVDKIMAMVHTLNGKNTHGFHSCLELLNSNPGSQSGVYTITPFGQSSPISVYCDMKTQGGGWTLIAQTVARVSACDGSCPNGERNLYNLRQGGGDFKNAPRGKATWSLPNAASLAQKSTEIAIARWQSWEAGTGDIAASNAAAAYKIPNPASVNFANPSHLNPDKTSRGNCVAVTVKSIVGSGCANGCTRYTFANSLGTTWTDTYPTSIGASTGSSCVNDNNGGPALASDDTGTFNPNYNGRWGKTSTESGSMFYWHEGLWDVDSKNHGGLGTVWLR